MGVNWKSHQTIEVTLRQVDTKYCTARTHTVPLHLQAPTYRPALPRAARQPSIGKRVLGLIHINKRILDGQPKEIRPRLNERL